MHCCRWKTIQIPATAFSGLLFLIIAAVALPIGSILYKENHLKAKNYVSRRCSIAEATTKQATCIMYYYQHQCYVAVWTVQGDDAFYKPLKVAGTIHHLSVAGAIGETSRYPVSVPVEIGTHHTDFGVHTEGPIKTDMLVRSEEDRDHPIDEANDKMGVNSPQFRWCIPPCWRSVSGLYVSAHATAKPAASTTLSPRANSLRAMKTRQLIA